MYVCTAVNCVGQISEKGYLSNIPPKFEREREGKWNIPTSFPGYSDEEYPGRKGCKLKSSSMFGVERTLLAFKFSLLHIGKVWCFISLCLLDVLNKIKDKGRARARDTATSMNMTVDLDTDPHTNPIYEETTEKAQCLHLRPNGAWGDWSHQSLAKKCTPEQCFVNNFLTIKARDTIQTVLESTSNEKNLTQTLIWNLMAHENLMGH